MYLFTSNLTPQIEQRIATSYFKKGYESMKRQQIKEILHEVKVRSKFIKQIERKREEKLPDKRC